MMKIANIQLPIDKTHQVIGSTMEIYDVIFDLESEEIVKVIAKLTKQKITSVVTFEIPELDVVMLLITKPTEKEAFRLYVAPNYRKLYQYFYAAIYKAETVEELMAYRQILIYVRENIEAPQLNQYKYLNN
ncbi:MAG: hypothetical protein IMZ64_00485 [Bacteroidetes bacterium]|nr:hypothetical protein [Bacteroidota bacterium]